MLEPVHGQALTEVAPVTLAETVRGSVSEGLGGTSWEVLPEDSYFSAKWEVRSSAEISGGGGGLGRRV